jgi:hypothetical protein
MADEKKDEKEKDKEKGNPIQSAISFYKDATTPMSRAMIIGGMIGLVFAIGVIIVTDSVRVNTFGVTGDEAVPSQVQDQGGE